MDDDIKDSADEIRNELKLMSDVELAELKHRLTTEVVATSHTSSNNKLRRKRGKPSELSSKQMTTVGSRGGRRAVDSSRDPRFDSMCGEVDKKLFRANYRFVEDELKPAELRHLERELNSLERLHSQADADDVESVDERINQIRYLIQRNKNQQRERKRLDMKAKGVAMATVPLSERREFRRLMKTDEALAKFEALQSSGKMARYVAKKSSRK